MTSNPDYVEATSPVTTEVSSPYQTKAQSINKLLKESGVEADEGGEDSGDVARRSEYLYGGKPPWGWDCVFSFKMPKPLRQKYGNQSTPTTPESPSPTEEDEQKASAGAINVDVYDDDDDDRLFKTAEDEILPHDNKPNTSEGRIEILARLKSAGFVFSQLVVPTEGVILVRISLPEKALKEKAVLIEHELKLKRRYGGGYLAYAPDREDKFINHELQASRKCYFTVADRALIIFAVLQSKEYWGCDVDIERILYEERVLQVFLLHAEPERGTLVRNAVWKRWWDPSYVPPLSDLKDYLGARVAFYFVFVTFYARRLLLISLISIPVYVVHQVLEDVELITILFWAFSISLVMWATLFLETWKRRTANVTIRWGLHDYKEETVDDTRAQFQGNLRVGFYCEGGFVSLADLVGEEGNAHPSEENRVSEMEEGQEEGMALRAIDLPRNRHQNPVIARNAKVQSFIVTTFFVLVVGGLTFLLLWYRTTITNFFLDRNHSSVVANLVPGLLNGVMITLFDPIWRSVSLILTRRENHRTNQLFENSLIYKRFAFQFVSNYVSLFYIAFVRPYFRGMCTAGFTRVGDSPSCMAELSSQVMSLMITRATLGQFMELIMPFIISCFKRVSSRWRSRRHPSTTTTPEEARTPNSTSPATGVENRYVQESKLSEYESTLDDYNELVIQFGYITLFGLAFPPACAISLLNNWIEVRTDAFKVLRLCQRPPADDAADIGAWYYILEFLNFLSVVTNVGLLVFTADSVNILFNLQEVYPNDPWRIVLYSVVVFFIAEHILLSMKGLLATAIRDIPAKTYRTIARQQFDIAKWFNIGWKNAFRGVSLLQVEERQIQLCRKYSQLFDVASQDTDENS